MRGSKATPNNERVGWIAGREGQARFGGTGVGPRGIRRCLKTSASCWSPRRWDPMRPLRWVSKSHAKLAAALCAMGHQIAKSRPGSHHEAIIVERRLSARDRLTGFVAAATNCATSSVPGPALINILRPTTVGSTSSAAPRPSWACCKPPNRTCPSSDLSLPLLARNLAEPSF
jgi:hypothetical protein